MRKIVCLALLLLFSARALYSQDQAVISATLLDAHNKKPVHLAVISLKSSNISIVTNQDGYFTLKLPADRVTPRDSVSISYLGYATLMLPVTILLQKDNKKTPELFLYPIAYSLDPAIIHPNEPTAIFDLAFAKVKNNFTQDDVSMSAFYREIFRKGNREYLSLNEAVVDISKPGYRSTGKSSRVALYKGRKSTNIEKGDSLLFSLRGGPLSALDLDIVKDPFVGVYLKDAHVFYDFEFGEHQVIDDKIFIVLLFKEKKDPERQQLYYMGKIFIELGTYAIGRIEFEMDLARMPDAEKYFIKSKPKNYKFDILSTKYIANYKEDDRGLWNFSYSRFDLELSAYKRFSLFKKHYYITSELAITDIIHDGATIAPEDRLKYSDIISNKMSDFEDGDFWMEYNVIEPDQSIEIILNRIIRQLKREDRRR